MTITLEALLQAVNDHEVWLNRDGTSELTDREYFGVSDPICDVTDEVRAAYEARLIERPRPGSTLWRITRDSILRLEGRAS